MRPGSFYDSLDANIFGDELILTWDAKKDFHSGITFLWRNILIHLAIDVTTTWKSRSDTLTTIVNGETFYHGFGRSTIGAGSIGKAPKIETLDHYLSFTQQSNRVIIKDNLKEGEPLATDAQIPFEIISIPSIPIKEAVTFNKIKKYKSKAVRDQILLFESVSDSITKRCLAYFDCDILKVSLTKIQNKYEDKYTVVLSKNSVDVLFLDFEIANNNFAELLLIIFNVFSGENVFESFKDYLTLRKIQFEEIESIGEPTFYYNW